MRRGGLSVARASHPVAIWQPFLQTTRSAIQWAIACVCSPGMFSWQQMWNGQHSPDDKNGNVSVVRSPAPVCWQCRGIPLAIFRGRLLLFQCHRSIRPLRNGRDSPGTVHVGPCLHFCSAYLSQCSQRFWWPLSKQGLAQAAASARWSPRAAAARRRSAPCASPTRPRRQGRWPTPSPPAGVCACVRVLVCVRVRACMHGCVRACACVRACMVACIRACALRVRVSVQSRQPRAAGIYVRFRIP